MSNQGKTHKRYLLYRYYVVIAFLGFITGFPLFMMSFIVHKEPNSIQIIGFILLLICFLTAIYMGTNILVFPFEYSIFGNLQRTPFPNEQPLMKINDSWGQIGIARGTIPFFSWYVFPSGLGISILGFGKMFIPVEQIKGLNHVSNKVILGSRYEVIHTSKEINDPIYFADKKLFEALQKLILSKSESNNAL